MASPPVRRASSADVDAIVRLWREMWDYHTPFDPRFRAGPETDIAMASW